MTSPTLLSDLQTVGDCFRRAQLLLPYNEAQLLTTRTLDLTSNELTLREAAIIPETARREFAEALRRRCSDEPLAYILQTEGFRCLTLLVSQDVLIPRQDSETLVEAVLPFLTPDSKVLDLGTGSGNIGLALTQESQCQITLVDLSEKALAVARKNALNLSLEAEFVVSDWFANVVGLFDVIVSNPPYVANGDRLLTETSIKYEPKLALEAGADGLFALRQIIENAPQYLNQGGVLAVEHGNDQEAAVHSLFDRSGFQNIMCTLDLNAKPRVTHGFVP